MQITWDLIILLIALIGIIYGALIGKKKIVGVLVNLYIALATVLIIGEQFHSFVSNFQIISKYFAASPFGSKMILLVVITALLTIKSELSGLESTSISKLQGGIYGFLTVGFLLTMTFNFMNEAQLENLNSNFALLITRYQAAWVVLPVGLMIMSSFFKTEKKSKKKK